MEKLRVFEESRIGASVLLPGKRHGEELEIGEHGVLAIPTGLKPAGFYLVLVVPQEARMVLVHRNIAQDKGAYHQYALAQLGGTSSEGFTTWVMYDPIQVMRVEQNVWTVWHGVKPNRVDCWTLENDGRCTLFQVGVITHDDGATFRLLSRWAWRGQLFQDQQRGIVGKPDDPLWGSFDARRTILEDLSFKKLLEETTLKLWTGTPKELDPPLDLAPGADHARMQWYSPFAGQTGQGPAVLYDGSAAWVHGADILDPPDHDGIKRLYRNDLVSYVGTHTNWGTKKDAPPKLLCVKKVS